MGKTTNGKLHWRALAGRRWDEGDARHVLEAWRASGQSAYAFARDHGLNSQRLLWWRKRLAEWEVQEDAKPGLVAAEILAPRAATPPVRLHTRSGVLLEVDAVEVDARWVATLVRELDEGAP
jgi:hypothetical protein